MKKLFTLLLFMFALTNAFSQIVVISQVYGGGGGSGANTYKQDYVELHNVSTTTQALDGFSLQYGSATGQFSSVATIPAGTSIPAGGYLFVSLGTVGTGGADFPVAADLNLNLNLSATGGKILLANQAATVGCGATATPCTLPAANIIDLVAYGTANNAEGGAAVAALSGTTGAVRKNNGCTDTNNNAADFDVVTAPVPRNAATTPFSCGGPAVATLTASPNITGLTTTFGNPSAEATFTLSGSNLTGFPGNISVTGSANIQVSLTSGGTFTTAVNVPYASATLASTTIYVRIAATAPAGAVNGTVTLAGGGDADGASITVTGSVAVAEPTTQATNVIFSNISNNGVDANWTNGNGTSRLVVVRATTGTTEVAPTDGTEYTVGQFTGTGNRVVFAGTGSGPVSIASLTGGTQYTVQVYEYNGSAGSNNYLTTTGTGNPNTFTTTGVSPNLAQVNFTSVATPLYGASGTATRLPVMFYATVSGLTPNTTYRYINQAAATTDFGTTALGAGNAILIDHTVSPMTFIYSSAPSVTAAGSYGLFETDASGSFTGAFGYVNTGNARFNAGEIVYPSIAIAEDIASPTIQFRFALNVGVTSLAFGTTASATEGTFIKGLSSAAPGNIVGLWSTVDGNLVAQRPLAMTIAENITTTGATWAASFVTGYDLTAGAWNTIIPNANANGVRLIQQFSLATGAVIGCNSDADGTWASGAATVNPTGGTTAIQITATDAPINTGSCFGILPVSISSFNVQKSGNNARIIWSTDQEINSREFVIERSSNQRTWTTVTTVNAAGTSAGRINYSVIDNAPASGINFYRIKLVDTDNSFDYSVTKSLLFGNATLVLVTPNPASTFATIYMGKADNSLTQLIVSDMNGKVVENVRTNDQTYTLHTSRYGKGMYVVRIITGANTSTHKLIVQ